MLRVSVSSTYPLRIIRRRVRVIVAALNYRDRNFANFKSFAVSDIRRNVRLFIIRSANSDDFALFFTRHTDNTITIAVITASPSPNANASPMW